MNSFLPFDNNNKSLSPYTMGSVMNPQQTTYLTYIFFDRHFVFKTKNTNNSVTLLKIKNQKKNMKFNNNNNIGKTENVRTKLT